MSGKFFVFLISLIFLALFLITPKDLLFYDAPEYLRLVSGQNFLTVLTSGHSPIHPIFMGFLWIGVHILGSGNLTALFFGILSIILFFQLSKYFPERPYSYWATFIFALFPAVSIINTNLMVESLALTFFLLAGLLFMRAIVSPTLPRLILFAAGVFFLVGIHIQTIFWLPVLFALPFLLNKKVTEESARFNKLFWATVLGVGASIGFYALLFKISGQPVFPSLRQLFIGRASEFFGYASLVRAVLLPARNLGLSLLRGFGGLTPFLLALILLKKRSDKRFLAGFIIFSLALAVSGTIWTGDFMVRRLVFAALPLALLFAAHFRNKSFLIILYLIPIFVLNGLLYLGTKIDMPLSLMNQAEKSLPGDAVLIQTHYVRPFTFDGGDFRFWVGEEDFDKLDNLLEKRKVYMDSQAIFAPYLLYVGNNLHITSLAKFGESETQTLFSKYVFDLASIENPDKRIFILELKNKGEDFLTRMKKNQEFVDSKTALVLGKAKPGSPVFIYSNNFWQRIHRERIDYGDITTWLWVPVSRRHEPLAWTFADKDGFFVYPISSREINNVFVRGPSLEEYNLVYHER